MTDVSMKNKREGSDLDQQKPAQLSLAQKVQRELDRTRNWEPHLQELLSEVLTALQGAPEGVRKEKS